MRDVMFDIALGCAVVGLIGSLLWGGSVVLCTVTLNPIAPGMLTTMVRLMMLAATGGLSATLIFGRRLSAIQEW